MAHEISHAMGLYYEHQKTGAGLKLICENLRDCDDVKKADSVRDIQHNNECAGAKNDFNAVTLLLIPLNYNASSDSPVDFEAIVLYGSQT